MSATADTLRAPSKTLMFLEGRAFNELGAFLGALPLLSLADRGFKGNTYGTVALVNPDFVHVGGKAAEGIQVSAGPVIVAEQLPDDHFAKEIALDFRAVQPEELVVKVATAQLEPFGDELLRQRAFAGRAIEQQTARQRLQNIQHRFVQTWPRYTLGPAVASEQRWMIRPFDFERLRARRCLCCRQTPLLRPGQTLSPEQLL